MNGSIFDRPNFQPRAFAVQLGLAIFLFASWAYSDAGRAIWDQLDQWVFFTFNGSLTLSEGWATLWALGNSRWADLVSALILGGMLLHFVQAGGRHLLAERVALGIFIGLLLGVTAEIAHTLVTTPRESASLVLKPVNYLSELVTDIKTKDRSTNSFPGDHATVLWMVTVFFWYYGGKRYGLGALAMALLFVLPRLVGGAHWFTDVTAGALSLSLASTAIAFYTPLDQKFIACALKILNRAPFQKLLNLIPICFGFLVCRSKKEAPNA